MTDIQAALGSSQLKRLDEFLKSRNEIASRYNILLREADIQLPVLADGNYSSYHLYPVQLKNRAIVYDRLRSNNVGVNVHYIPIHLQPFYRKKGFSPGDFPNSEKYYSRTLSIPLHPGLTEKDQDKIISALKDALSA